MLFRKLAIGITDRCTAACDMCCFSCSPKGKMKLEKDVLTSVIDEISPEDGIKAIGWTGGEAFLCFDEMLECSAYAKSKGLRITVNSNGYWGNDPVKARRMVRELKQAGIELISFSADRFHQKFVPLEHLRTALRICDEEGVLTNVSFMDIKDSDDIITMTEKLRPEIYHTSIQPHPMLPVGRAAEKFSAETLVTGVKTATARCPFIGLLNLCFDGAYYFCCSQFCREIPLLRLGQAGKTPFKDIEKKVSANPYLYVMMMEGFSWFIDRAKEAGIPVPEYMCTACQLCHYIFSKPDFLKSIRAQVEQEADRLRLKKLLGA